MKKILLVILLVIAQLTGIAQITKVEFVATGLTCSMCSNAIVKSLKTIPDVVDVNVDLNKNMFIAILKKNNAVSPKIFKDKVEKAGFFIGTMYVTMPLQKQNIEDGLIFTNGTNEFKFVQTKPNILDGVAKLEILNKGYVTNKAYKSLSKSLNLYPSYAANNNNIFHVRLL
jgi:copper chaperone CopZ